MRGERSTSADHFGRWPGSSPAELGPVGLSAYSFSGVPEMRTPASTGPCDNERYRLSLFTTNGLLRAEEDQAGQAGVDVLTLHDERLPHGFRAMSGSGGGGDIGSGKMVTLHFPKAALPLRPPALAPLFARQLPADSGMGAILARYLASVASALEKGEVGEREGEHLGTVALDLAVMTLTAWAGVGDVTAPESHRQALLAKIETFIERNLGDPDFTPSVIAGHHHSSVGHLHRLFQARELTIAAWIRHRRLERCRADLADPRHRTRPVFAIGVRWGFRSAAEFSRAFRVAYGSAPGHYRRQVLSRE